MRIIKEHKVIKKHICTFCKRVFTRKTSYEKHLLICEEINKSKHLIHIEEEEDENIVIPTKLQMMKIIENLVVKVNKLEKEVKELKSNVKTIQKKKQIDVIDILNKNYIANSDFFDTIKGIKLNREHMFSIINTNYIDGIYQIFQYIYSIEDYDSHNIKCFNVKSNIFYISIKDKDNYIWKQLTNKDFIKALKIIDIKIWNLFMEYKKEKQNDIDKSDEMYQKFISYSKKINGYSKSTEKNCKEILLLLYKYLKTTIKSVVEYETNF